MEGTVPVGLRIRRARKQMGLSQKVLADRVGVSQAVISFYETGHASPSAGVYESLALVLGFGPMGEVPEARGSETLSATLEAEAEPLRSAFLRTVPHFLGDIVLCDFPAGATGGDLAFAVALRSHSFLVVIDAQGSGPTAAPQAKATAACAAGAIFVPGGGAPTPEDVVGSVTRFWALVEGPARAVAICVVSFDQRNGRLRQCRLGMPAPFLRSGRVGFWTGTPDGPAGAHVGERQLEENSLLVVATDGIANLPTKGDRPLWRSPQLRSLVTRAPGPAVVANMLSARAKRAAPSERADDRLAVVVAPWTT